MAKKWKGIPILERGDEKINLPTYGNNPGALMADGTLWDGLEGVIPAGLDDKGNQMYFMKFINPEMGTRAMVKNLYNAKKNRADKPNMTLHDYFTEVYAPLRRDKYGDLLPKFGVNTKTKLQDLDVASVLPIIPQIEGYGKLNPELLQLAKAQLMSEGFAPVANALGGTLLPAPKPMKPGVK